MKYSVLFREKRAFFALFALFCGYFFLPLSAHAANYPSWWISRNVINTNATTTNDYAAINAGQLKWFATNAYEELKANLPGGAGANVENMITGFSATNNYYAVNLGQLKNLASNFYDRLIAEGYTNTYPWTSTTTDDVDYAAANIGQVKNVFSFDIAKDTDSDDLPDWWEIRFFGDITSQSGNDDRDGDGVTNLQEYTVGIDPTDWDSDGDLFPDGWEIEYGYEPTVLSSPDPSNDPDSDGLTTYNELRYGTDPHETDSDRDGVSDGDEVARGSDPSEASDKGNPVNCIPLELVVGDHSENGSERYELKVGSKTIHHQSSEFGQLATNTYAFACGKAYEFQVRWIDTKPGKETEYEYTARIGGLGGAEGWTHGECFLIHDAEGILGVHEERTYDFAAGKTGTLYVVKVEEIEVTAGGTGNTDTGPGDSPLNRAVACAGWPVRFEAILAPVTPENRGTECVRWIVLDGQAGDEDGDRDGICDNIDLAPTTNSDEFSDISLGGSTHGIITNRGDRTFQVFDAENPSYGVHIIVSTGSAPAEIESVGYVPVTTITIPAGEAADFIFTCQGSIQIQLLSGVLHATAEGIDTIVTAVLVGESTITFDLVDPQTLEVTSAGDSTAPIEVSVNAEPPVILTPGECLPIAFSSDIDGDGILDGIDQYPNSDTSPTVIIDGIDTGAPNSVNEQGWTISDMISECAVDVKNHGQFVSSVAHLLERLVNEGMLTEEEAEAIQSAAARSSIGRKEKE